jgi:hypothetical protein
VSRYWEDIKAALLYSVPPLAECDEEGMANILESFLSGKLKAWISADDKGSVYALLVTCFLEDVGTRTKNLLIYALCGYKLIPDLEWKSGLQTLREYAVSNKCRAIVAYSKVPRIIEVSQSLGADPNMRFIEWRL